MFSFVKGPNSPRGRSSSIDEYKIPAHALFSSSKVLNIPEVLHFNRLVCTGEHPSERYGHTATLFKKRGLLCVFGGTSGGSAKNSMFFFDLNSRKWQRPKTAGKTPSHRHGHTACAWKQKIVLFGGTSSAKGKGLLNDFHIFNIIKLQWKQPKVKGKKPPPRKYHSAYVYQDKLVIYGGEGKGGVALRDVWALDLVTKEWSMLEANVKTESKCCNSLNVYKKAAMAISYGGLECTKRNKRPLKSLTVWSLWKGGNLIAHPIFVQTRNKGPVIWAHGAVLWKGNLVVVGGIGCDGETTRDVHVFSFAHSSWSQKKIIKKENTLSPCSHFTATLYKDKVIVFGGRNQHGEAQNTLYTLHLCPSRRHLAQLSDTSVSLSTEDIHEAIVEAVEGKVLDLSLLDIGESISGGATCVVHKGVYKDRAVAVKKYFTPDSTEFLREVSILSQVDHPNIVSFIGATTGEFDCIVTEFVEMGNLSQYLQSQALPLAMTKVLSILRGLACGLNYLHDLGLLHRDLKSHNVLVAGETESSVEVKLTDFGTTRDFGGNMTKGNVGTIRWTPPEIKFNVAAYSPASDVYSLGIIFWEVLARKTPFSELQFDYQVEEAVQRGERPSIPTHCPLGLRILIESCWHTDPARRIEAPKILDILADFGKKLLVREKSMMDLHHRHRSNSTGFTAYMANKSKRKSLQSGAPKTEGDLSELIVGMASLLDNLETRVPKPEEQWTNKAKRAQKKKKARTRGEKGKRKRRESGKGRTKDSSAPATGIPKDSPDFLDKGANDKENGKEIKSPAQEGEAQKQSKEEKEQRNEATVAEKDLPEVQRIGEVTLSSFALMVVALGFPAPTPASWKELLDQYNSSGCSPQEFWSAFWAEKKRIMLAGTNNT